MRIVSSPLSVSGTFSPRTISLASSIKLQQELEYHIQRLGEIAKEMETVGQIMKKCRFYLRLIELNKKHVYRIKEWLYYFILIVLLHGELQDLVRSDTICLFITIINPLLFG